MDLKLKNKHILVTGCSSGLARGVAERLLNEGADVTGIARNIDKLNDLKDQWPDQFTGIRADLYKSGSEDEIFDLLSEKPLYGMLLNAGGPPVMQAKDTRPEHWDAAYHTVFRWKAALVLKFLPKMRKSKSGRIIFIESQSVKQPIPKLALSTSMRLAVTGFAKSLAGDLAESGITVNVIAPGSHSTPAIERVIEARAKDEGISKDEARNQLEAGLPMKRMGTAEEIGALAGWLFSEHSSYITGQTISHDGGNISHLFG